MRYIDINKIKIPDGWEKRAEEALREIENLPEQERKEAIYKKEKLWQELKKSLAELSHRKCWYCETKENRSDNHVDHFRPKNNVKDTNHPGYWWLAFSWENYRYSCTFCNSRRKDTESGTVGGKGDHFPLLDESKRCCNKSDNLNKEKPLLLDPVKPRDPGLIWFDQDGKAVPKYTEADNEIAFKRAEKSIELYHLNYCRLKETRIELYRRIKELINQGDESFNNSDRTGTSGDVTLDKIFGELIKYISEESEYTAAAKTFLLGYRDKDRDWIDMVIQSS